MTVVRRQKPKDPETSKPEISGEVTGDLLQEETDALNMALRQAEQVIEEMRYGVWAEVDLRPGAILTFKKKGREWGLYVAQQNDEVPVTSASRADRIAAAQQIPALIEAIRKAALRELESVKEARQKVAQFVKDVRDGKYNV